MAYATPADLVARYGADEVRQLTDRELPAQGDPVDAVAQTALDDASATVDGFIGTRYSTPLGATYPPEIVRVTCEIARYALHGVGVPETVRLNYADALRWLRSVADGKLALVGADGSLVAMRQGGLSLSAVSPYGQGGAFGAAFAAAWQPAQ